jgi:exosortase B
VTPAAASGLPASPAASVDRWSAGALLAGLLALVLPTWWDFLAGPWVGSSQGHEPLVLAAAGFLAWRRRDAFAALPLRSGPAWLAMVVLAMGLLMYLVGRSLQFLRIELVAPMVVLASVVLHYKGRAGLRTMAVPLLALLFALPLPYGVVLALTGPMKTAVSAVTTYGLDAIGYPIGRSGVVITVGQYQLLVAEACAGLQTMFALEAFGLFYTQLMNYRHWQRSALMAVLVIPVGFIANVIRTAVLVLVTYHFGDEVGQGFVHGFAGLLLFAVAIVMIHALDRLLGRVLPRRWVG